MARAQRNKRRHHSRDLHGHGSLTCHRRSRLTESCNTAQTASAFWRKDRHRHRRPLLTAASTPAPFRGSLQQLRGLHLGTLGEVEDARAERKLLPADEPDSQIFLNRFHDGVLDGQAWNVLLSRVVGLPGNDSLEHTTQDSTVKAPRPTPSKRYVCM